MKKRNSQLIKKSIWVLFALFALPTLVWASPAFQPANLVPAATESVGSISDQNRTVGDPADLTITATGGVTYTAAPLPAGVNFNNLTGVFSGAPTTAGEVTTNVTVEDISGTQIGTDSFKWNVAPAAPLNNPPVLQSISNITTAKNQQVSFFAVATDSDVPTDTLTYSAQNLPTGVSIQASTGKISGKAKFNGSSSVKIIVSDGTDSDEVTFTWTVKNGLVIGNSANSALGERVDGSPENMVINKSDWVRNDHSGNITINVTGFNFRAKTANVPITPFLVKVAAGVPIDDDDFTVVAIGTTRTEYNTGNVVFSFKDGGQNITLKPGETLLPGFLDADKNGNDGLPNDAPGGSTVALTEDSTGALDKIWYSHSDINNPNFQGYKVQLNQAPEPVKYGNSIQILQLNRDYLFNITLAANSTGNLTTPDPDALPQPAPIPDVPYQIKNGSFEEDSKGNKKTSLTHWEVINAHGDGVDIKSGTAPNGSRIAIEGSQSLDLNSSAISQTVSGLEVGKPYVLRVDYRVERAPGNGTTGYTGTVADAKVIIDNVERGMGINSTGITGIHTNEDFDFVACNGFEFTATATTATIIFESEEISGNATNGVILDNVHLLPGTMPGLAVHNVADLGNLPGGWLALPNGDFQTLPTDPTETLENSGSLTNPHLCGNGLPEWRVTRENVDLVGQNSPIPPGSEPSGNLLLDLGGRGPGGMGQTITGLTPNTTYIMRFYAGRHFFYGTDDMTSELWANGEHEATIVRTIDQDFRNEGFFLELVEIDSNENGEIAFEIFSTAQSESGNIVYDNFSIIAKDDFPTLSPIGTVTNNVGDEVLYELTSSSTVTNPLEFSATNLPTGLMIDKDTGAISGTTTTAGTFNGTVSVKNAGTNDPPLATVPFTWIVNTNPVINPNSLDDRSNTQGESVDFDIEATDDDPGDEADLGYFAEGLPEGVVIISNTGKVTGTLESYGMFTVTVTVTDTNGGEATGTFNWDVNALPILPELGDQKSNINEAISVDAGATDPDTGDTLTYSATGLPTGLEIDPATGLISGTVTTAQGVSVTVKVEDGEGGEDSETISWLFNTAPVISSTHPDVASNEGDDATSVTAANATDADGDTITYSAVNLPPGVSINPANGVFSGVITGGGMFAVIITADDGNGGTATVSFNWDVNSKPELTNPGDQNTNVNSVVDMTIVATDADGDSLTYSATGLPTGLSIDSATGKVSGTAGTVGSYDVEVKVEDPDGLSDTVTFKWVVNTPPVIKAVADQTGERGETVSLTIEATDADGDTITYSATDLPTGLSIDPSTGEITGTLFSGGKWTSTITASDGNGGETTITVLWDIGGIVVPPTGLIQIFLPIVVR